MATMQALLLQHGRGGHTHDLDLYLVLDQPWSGM
jgi:hypothetical protein